MSFRHYIVIALCILPTFMLAQTDAEQDCHNKELAPLLLQDNNMASYTHSFNVQTRHTVKERHQEPPETTFAHCILTEAGTLASVLGDKIYDIDSIAVEGPINNADFNTLWDSSFNGHLKVINIQNTTIENGIIPDYAFFHIQEQVDWETLNIYTIWLEKLMLPEGITGIGDFAFAYATTLSRINFPTALKTIGKSAFTDNIRLTTDPLVFPENLETIGSQAFYNCKGLTGEIVLPNTLRRLDCGAFCYSYISKINIPQSLEFLGCFAFACCKLTGAYNIPDDCYLCPEGTQFYNNIYVTGVHLPDNSRFVPTQIVDGCISLTTVNVPSKTEYIEEFAYNSTRITHIEFPPTLKAIGQDAFQGCDKLETITLPPSLTDIGDRAFACFNLKEIFCMAAEPPVCNAGYDGCRIPFPYATKIPIYIPIGTKEAYLQAQGWNLLTNYIETDKFPYTGIDCIRTTISVSEKPMYDLMGRKLTHPITGHTYIHNGKKIIFR